MNKLFTIALVSSVVGAAFAQAPKTPTQIACAVMPSNKVDIAKATKAHMYADYKGKRYFFCCGGCPGAFKATPEKFAKAASIPTPKAPAKKAS